MKDEGGRMKEEKRKAQNAKKKIKHEGGKEDERRLKAKR
jgi:hypothetical protein